MKRRRIHQFSTAALLLVLHVSFTPSRAYAQTTSSPGNSYFEVLRKGVESLKNRSATGSGVLSWLGLASNRFQDKLIESKVDVAWKRLDLSMRGALNLRHGQGILYEIRIYKSAEGVKYLVDGGPRLIGMANSPSAAAATYLSQSQIENTPPRGTLRDSSSYMVWVTKNSNDLDFKRTSSPRDMAIWKEGDAILRRQEMKVEFGRLNEAVMRVALQGAEYAEAATIVQFGNSSAATKAEIQSLETARLQAAAAWAASMEELSKERDKATRAAFMSDVSKFLAALSVGVSAAEASTSAESTVIDGVEVTKPDEATKRALADAKRATLSAQSAQQAQKNAEAAALRANQALTKMRNFILTIVGFPSANVPAEAKITVGKP